MQGGRGGRYPFFDMGDPLASFGGLGGFGSHRSLLSNVFGGRDPFDDPFFTRPFGSIFESSFPFMVPHTSGFLQDQPFQPTSGSRGPIIEELNSDDDKDKEGAKEKKYNPRKHARSSKGPYVEDPDDDAEELNSNDDKDKEGAKEKKDNPRKYARSSKGPYVEDPDDDAEERNSKQIQFGNDFNRGRNIRLQPLSQSFSFQSSSVTYGGAKGPYYTSSRTRRTGSDGLSFEECKEADSATGQATHQVSRGIHDKGHSVTRKLNSVGKVDTMQMLHNLNEDQLTGFEEAWKRNTRKHLPGWNEGLTMQNGSGGNAHNGSSRGGWALPSTELPPHSASLGPNARDGLAFASSGTFWDRKT